jgi:hypothetical protein
MALGSGIWDLRSGIRKKPIPDPGSRIQWSKRHRIRDPDPEHCDPGTELFPSRILDPHQRFFTHFYPSRITWSKKAPDPGTRIWIRNTGTKNT